MEVSLGVWEVIVLCVAGIGAGWINVMAGGGSLLTLPIMLFIGIPAPVANGTNRIGIITQNIAAVYGFRRRGFSDFKLSFSLSVCASLGAAVGAYHGAQIEGKAFNYLLVAVMITVIILTFLGGEKKVDHAPGAPKRVILGHILMLFAGAWGGLIQVGVGFLIMPILNRVMGLDLVHTNMHKVFIALTYSLLAVAIFARISGVLLVAGLVLASGTMLGGYLGAQTSVSKGEVWIKAVLYAMLSLFIIKLLFFD